MDLVWGTETKRSQLGCRSWPRHALTKRLKADAIVVMMAAPTTWRALAKSLNATISARQVWSPCRLYSNESAAEDMPSYDADSLCNHRLPQHRESRQPHPVRARRTPSGPQAQPSPLSSPARVKGRWPSRFKVRPVRAPQQQGRGRPVLISSLRDSPRSSGIR